MILFSQVKNAADGATWKAASMRGYMTKTVTDATTGAFKLTFKKANGTTTYEYTVSAAGVVTAPSTAISVSGEFLKLLMSTWSQVNKDDADAVLGGSGEW